MDTKIALCGLYCGACKIYMATDNNEIQDLSVQTKIPVAILECCGCRSDKNNLCCMNCGMKRCCLQKGIQACSECEEFPCSVLTAFEKDEHLHHSGVIESLKKFSKNGSDVWLREQNLSWSPRNCNVPFPWYESQCENCGGEVSGYPIQ